jgi:threonine aldolase
LEVGKPETNIVMIGTPENLPGPEFVRIASAVGVRLISVGPRKVRAVTHRMVDAADIKEAVKRLKKALQGG